MNKLQKRQNSVNQNFVGQSMRKKCVKLHTECKSILGLCKNKRKYAQITQSVWNYPLNNARWVQKQHILRIIYTLYKSHNFVWH